MKEKIAIGFIDEISSRNIANNVRVWSFEKILIDKNTNFLKSCYLEIKTK